MTRWVGIAGLGAASLLAACGGTNAPPLAATVAATSSDPTSSGSTNTACAPSGTSLKLVGKDTKFVPACLTAPAGKALTIAFDNQDSLPHNISVYSGDPMTTRNVKSLFQGTLVTGPTKTTYSVPALAAGTYFFNCVVHPQMVGSLVVK
ncbi:MAG TPA: cupredoxin domain-containing protein [Candidatus Dormibacteraeota bacterium]